MVPETAFSPFCLGMHDGRRRVDRDELWLTIVTCSESTHHPCRRHQKLGNPTPIEFEAITITAPASVARSNETSEPWAAPYYEISHSPTDASFSSESPVDTPQEF